MYKRGNQHRKPDWEGLVLVFTGKFRPKHLQRGQTEPETGAAQEPEHTFTAISGRVSNDSEGEFQGKHFLS